jgi:hypothetical protein
VDDIVIGNGRPGPETRRMMNLLETHLMLERQ